ncbi:MAG: PAS domain S-box protein, partial [Burkholderiales bacterium]|nr:PAS domain S-box protein [Burkholderiales bacterium]
MSVLSRPSAPNPAQLTALLDSAEEALVLVDARARVGYCNHAAMRLLGCEPGQSIEAALSRLAEPGRHAVLQALAETATTAERPFAATLLDGLVLRLVLTPGTGGQRLLRARTDTAPAAPRLPPLGPGATGELVRLLWDLPQPLTLQSSDFRIVAANRAYYDSFGQAPAQVLQHDPVEWMSADDQSHVQEVRAALRAALDEGRQPDLAFERRVIDATGRERWFRVAPRWVSADDGSPLLLALLQDCTLERQARAQANRSADEIDQWFDLSPIGMLVYDQA